MWDCLGSLLQLENLEVNASALVRDNEKGINGTLRSACLFPERHVISCKTCRWQERLTDIFLHL